MSLSGTSLTYPLHEAAKAGDFEKVEELSKSLDPNQMDDKGLLPIQYAAGAWHRDVILFLLPLTKNVEKLTVRGTENGQISILLKAVNSNDFTVTHALIEQGADLLAVDEGKFNVLQIALFLNNTELALFLISAAKKLKVAKQLLTKFNVEGNTALHSTAYYLNYRVASALLEISPSISYFLLTHKNNVGENASETIDSRDDFLEPLKSVTQEKREIILRKYLLKTKKAKPRVKDELEQNNKDHRSSVKERPEFYRESDRGAYARRQVLEIKRKALDRVKKESETFLQKITAALAKEEKEQKEEDEAFEKLRRERTEREEKINRIAHPIQEEVSKSPIAEEKFPIPAPIALSSDKLAWYLAMIAAAESAKVPSAPIAMVYEKQSDQKSNPTIHANQEMKINSESPLPPQKIATSLETDFIPEEPMAPQSPEAMIFEVDDSVMLDSNHQFKNRDSFHGRRASLDTDDEMKHAETQKASRDISSQEVFYSHKPEKNPTTVDKKSEKRSKALTKGKAKTQTKRISV